MSALVLTALLLAAAPSVPVDAASTQEVMQRIYAGASRAVVQVGDDPKWAGTVLSESGIIATSAQGLASAKSIAVTFTNGYRATAEVVAVDEKLGVALLHAGGLPPMAYLAVSPLPLQPTQAAYALHLSKPLVPTITFARVSSTSVSRDGRIDDRYLTAHFALDGHARGGPVVSYAGQLIGMVLTSDPSGVGFAVSGRALLELVSARAGQLPVSAVVVASDPSGAEVLLDGVRAGTTPATLAKVPAGEHLVSIRAPGLPDSLRRVVALGPSEQRLAITLFPGAGVRLQAPAGAKIFVDGLWLAVGSTELYLPGGRHLVQATLAGRRSFAQTIEVVEGRPLSLVVELPEQHATLSVDSTPSGAEVMLDDNRVGQTPMKLAPVTPGTYELTISRPGFHILKRAVSIPDGLDVNLGQIALESPHAAMVAHAPPMTEVALDGGPRHLVKDREEVAPGNHRAVFFAPYQYASVAQFHGEDGETIQLSPVFVAAGSASGREVTHTLSTVVEGGAGVLSLVATGFFIAAESDRESSDTPDASSSLHSHVEVGLITAGIGLGLYAASAFIDALQPTPDMGFGETASGEVVAQPAPKSKP